MTENIQIDDSKYLLDWNNGYILIIDFDKSQYIRFWIDSINTNIELLLKELLFKKVVDNAINGEYGNWKIL